MRLTPAQRAEFAERAAASEGETIQLANPVSEHFIRFIHDNSRWRLPVVQKDEAHGRTLAICGAGPSLAKHVGVLDDADDVWAINSALPWLVGRGLPVTHGMTTDQTPGLLREWESAPDVGYLVASSVAPNLVEHLIRNGRHVTIFHSYVGVQGPNVRGPAKHRAGDLVLSFEEFLYSKLYEPTVMVGSGLNSLTRAVDLSQFMGYAAVHILGADCAWEGDVFHVDGSGPTANGQTGTMLDVLIDDRLWQTKPDLIKSAIALVLLMDTNPLTIHGDVLPNHLIGRVDELIAALPVMLSESGQPVEV